MHSRPQWVRKRPTVCAAVLLRMTAAACFVAGMLAIPGGHPAHARQAPAPAKAKPVNPAEVKRLDARTEEVRESFLRETTKLIRSYEDVGQFERARTLLEALRKLDPQNESIKVQLERFDEQILDAHEFEFEIDPGKSWQPVGMVSKDQLVRIKVAGEYKMSGTFAIGPDGVPTADPAEDLVAGVPLGGLMGVVSSFGLSTAADAGRQNGGGRQNEKPPKPFAVGGSHQKPAERDGMLYLKVNVPPGSKCTGRLTAKISGPTRSP